MDGVDGRIVELNALPYSNGTRAQNDYLLFIRYYGLVLARVGRVEIGHIAVKLARAGVDHLIGREDILLAPALIYLVLASFPKLGYI